MAAFIFITPGADPSKHRAMISTPDVVDLMMAGVKDYQQAGFYFQGAGRLMGGAAQISRVPLRENKMSLP
jgi:hypothetical protein